MKTSRRFQIMDQSATWFVQTRHSCSIVSCLWCFCLLMIFGLNGVVQTYSWVIMSMVGVTFHWSFKNYELPIYIAFWKWFLVKSSFNNAGCLAENILSKEISIEITSCNKLHVFLYYLVLLQKLANQPKALWQILRRKL